MENYVDKSVANNTYYNNLYDNHNIFDFFLMHRSRRVALIRMKISRNEIRVLRLRVLDRNFLPTRLLNLETPTKYIDMGIAEEQYRKFLAAFNSWFNERLIPVTRVGFETVIKNIAGFTGKTEVLYDKGIAENIVKLIAIFTYGRNMTDKYWLNPVGRKGLSEDDVYTPVIFTNENNLYMDYGVNILSEDVNIHRRKDYKGLDFTKNGFSVSFYNNIFERENALNHVQFNFPDICTNGNTMKRWTSDMYGYYLEKIYPDNDFSKINQAIMLHEQMPTIFPEISELDIDITGYKTKCFTNGYTELINLKDICLWKEPDKNPAFDIAKSVMKSIGLPEKEVNDLIKTMENENISIDNAGVITSCNSGEIQRVVAWV